MRLEANAQVNGKDQISDPPNP